MYFDPGCRVRHFDNPGRQGTVLTGVRQRPSGIYREIRWDDGNRDFVAEDQLEMYEDSAGLDPFKLVQKGKFARADDFRRNLTYVYLSGKLANMVYSMGITNTDFYPYQYRPLLTLLDSAVNSLLIADEVGLGKTIEAGLIWTELRTRYDMRRLLVVCPAMLCEKWHDELSGRFGVDASIVKANDLLRLLKQPSSQLGEGKAWIVSYNGLRPPQAWNKDRKEKGEANDSRWQLCDLLQAQANAEPLFDMVIYDEAHYMRNKDTATWRLGGLLSEVAEYQVMLSATPINMRNSDLFNLLQLLDPDHFQWHTDFESLLGANEYLIKARDTVLNRKSSVKDIREILQKASQHHFLSNHKQLSITIEKFFSNDNAVLSDEMRSHISAILERMNLISFILTRTRKRDVLDKRIQREVHRESVQMTALEQEVYERVTSAVEEYARSKNASSGFLLVSPQRGITSCPAATIRDWQTNDTNDDYMYIEDDEGLEAELDEKSYRPLRAFISTKVSDIDFEELKNNDNKYKRLKEIAIKFIKDNPDEKAILFTSFRATAKYLCERLNNEQGLQSQLLLGGLRQSKQEIINEFRENKNLRFLISTEVAAEGVDLQFCRFLINYDLPWNPTRIEQRIGRIDRLGQKADKICIWNLYFADTIDARIVHRLLERIKIFESALGLTEASVGQLIHKLEYDLLMMPHLTPEQKDAEIDRAAVAIELVLRQHEELEKNAPHMMAHGHHIIEQMEAARALSRSVTNHDLYLYVRDYLSKFDSCYRFVQEGNDKHTVTIQLSSVLSARLEEFCAERGLSGKTSLTQGVPKRCQFLNKISHPSKRGEEIIHQFHPLIRFIAHDIKARDEHLYPVVAVEIDAKDLDNNYNKAGIYAFVIRLWIFNGVREEDILAVQAVSLNQGNILNPEESESLIQGVRKSGRDWIAPLHGQDSEKIMNALDECEHELQRRYDERKEQKILENDDRVQFQLDAIARHLQSTTQKKTETRQQHENAGRESLAKATQGQIDKLTARMNAKKETVKRKGSIELKTDFICMGLIQVFE